jgi:membrane protease subunit HflC
MKNPLTLIIGVLLLFLVALLLIMFQVRTTQVAVVTRFGRPVRDITEPGANFKFPWPIERVYFLEKPVQNFEDKFTEDLTADNNAIMTSVYVGWRITEPKEFFPRFAGGSVAEAERTLGGIVHNAKTGVLGKHALSDLISVEGRGAGFIAVENEILTNVQAQVASAHYGIAIEFLGFKRIGLPESVTQAVFERMSSERQVLISRSQNEGEAEARKIRSEAELRAAEILSDAEGKATEIRGQGYAEAANSLAALQQNPKLANFLYRLDAIENAFKQRTTLFIDQQTAPFDLFTRGYLDSVSTNSAVK